MGFKIVVIQMVTNTPKKHGYDTFYYNKTMITFVRVIVYFFIYAAMLLYVRCFSSFHLYTTFILFNVNKLQRLRAHV